MQVKALSVAALLAVPVLMSGCSKGASANNPPSPSASPTASPTPSATPSPKPAPKDPLTGLAPVTGPVVAVKIDNGVLARPYQRGLRQAAVIYQELVEGGATRFMAVFEGDATREVGPIRSARESDLSILRAFGEPALAFSGANPGVTSIIRAAARRDQVVDASYNAVPGMYRLGERRRDARNFFAVPAELGKRRGGSEPRDIGFRFGAVGAGPATTTARVVFSPYTTMRVRYQPTSGMWSIIEQGRVVPFSAANVLVQHVTVKRSRFSDVNGMNSPLTLTTGTGRAVLMRDGQRQAGKWVRKGYGPTRLVDGAGRPIKMKPGPTFVMLVPRGASVSFG